MNKPDRSAPPLLVVVQDRDRTADDRDHTSTAHDKSAADRDVRSEERDARAEGRDVRRGSVDTDAAADRAGAKRDRKGSAGDRKHSEDDRDAASADRVLAAVDRANFVVDGLTGAHQRAPGLAELERETVKARRKDRSFVLAFIDVDGLKAINDTQGHGAGDQVLRLVVAGLRRALREYDLILRYGGDEFLCGLSEIALEDVEGRLAATKKELTEAGISFSYGLASMTATCTLQEVIDRADMAMYEQRRNSRDEQG